MDWLVRTSKEKRRTDIFLLKDRKKILIATILNDFILERPRKLPLKVKVRNLRKKILGFIETFYPEKEDILVLSKQGKEIARLEPNSSKLAGRKFKKIKKSKLPLKEDWGVGIVSGYSFSKEKIYYFEKEGEIAGIIKDSRGFLEFLPLIICQRVWRQELVKKMMGV